MVEGKGEEGDIEKLEKLAMNSEKIGTLNITPDLLESLTGKKA